MIGEQVGNYIIESELGMGGMGAVYRARHATLGRPAAVKVLLPQFSATPDIVQRFFNEAKAATSIRHLGIVEIYDFGLMDTGVAFIAMELLRGESLGSRMRKRRMPPQAYLGIVRQMCGALGAAHDLGIVHRDLKPDNVFVVPDAEVASGERIKLLDFGIAKLSQESTGMASQTRTGSVMGTPAYMAPEQCRGVKVDHRADLYSLGCILYELISGRPPFRGEGVGDILAAHIYAIHEPVEKLAPETPPAVARLVDRLLVKDPSIRTQTTRALIIEIDAVSPTLDGAPPSASQTGSDAVAATLPASASDALMVSARPARVVAASAVAMPTTLSGAARATEPAEPTGGRSRRGLWLGGAGAVSAAAIAIALVATGTLGSAGHSTSAGGTASTAGSDAGAIAQTPTVDAAVPGASVAPPPAAVTVDVEIDSTPPGAQVLFDGKDAGTTPFHGTLPKAERPVQLALRHGGYDERRVMLHPNTAIKESLVLTATTVAGVKAQPSHSAAGTPRPVAPGAHPRVDIDSTAPLGDLGRPKTPTTDVPAPAHKLGDDEPLAPSHHHGPGSGSGG